MGHGGGWCARLTARCCLQPLNHAKLAGGGVVLAEFEFAHQMGQRNFNAHHGLHHLVDVVAGGFVRVPRLWLVGLVLLGQGINVGPNPCRVIVHPQWAAGLHHAVVPRGTTLPCSALPGYQAGDT